ncbi:MAG TPA: uL30 family ribosomal protein [Thermoplasmata archaeon]|nr:uL30 family ribosomal protein [Thermoplasmata archaeon]
MSWMVVRVRGTIHARHDITETLAHLHLTRPNHATVLPENPAMRGMLIKVQGYVTWGEADAATVGELLAQRGERTPGADAGAPGPEAAQQVTEHGFFGAEGWKPRFRLRAPKGGWKSTKKPFARGGALGYRGPKINDLVRRML